MQGTLPQWYLCLPAWVIACSLSSNLVTQKNVLRHCVMCHKPYNQIGILTLKNVVCHEYRPSVYMQAVLQENESYKF